jgi:hypothetical protein
LESISAVASSAVCIAVRTDAARLKSIAAPTNPMMGIAASASIGATPPSRFVHKRLSTEFPWGSVMREFESCSSSSAGFEIE